MDGGWRLRATTERPCHAHAHTHTHTPSYTHTKSTSHSPLKDLQRNCRPKTTRHSFLHTPYNQATPPSERPRPGCRCRFRLLCSLVGPSPIPHGGLCLFEPLQQLQVVRRVPVHRCHFACNSPRCGAQHFACPVRTNTQTTSTSNGRDLTSVCFLPSPLTIEPTLLAAIIHTWSS